MDEKGRKRYSYNVYNDISKEYMDRINLIFGLYPTEIIEDIEKNSINHVQYAADQLQWNLLEGFIENEVNVTVFNAMYIDSYPLGYKKLFIKDQQFHNVEAEINNVGFNNLIYINMLTKYFALKKKIDEKKENSSNEDVYILYSLTLPFLLCARYIKKHKKGKVVFIVTDLPEFMNTGVKPSIPYRILKPLEIKVINACKKYIDGYVYLTKFMSDFNEPNKPHMVMEGIAPPISKIVKSFNEKKIVLGYAGLLNEKYGIKELIDTVLSLPDNYTLEVCGSGDYQSELEKLASKSKKINFHGRVAHNEAIEILSSCDILINPRNNDEEFTKYSFPSKNLEYLAMLKPVVLYKLDGIPLEYDDYFYYANNKGLYQAIMDASDDLKNKKYTTEKLREFLVTKSRSEQTKRILLFCSEINKIV